MRRLSGKARLTLLALSALLLAAGVAVYLDQASPARSAAGVALVAGIRNPAQAAEKTLGMELRSEHLSFHALTCIENGRIYRRHPIIRCNVDFGDPHVVAYCTVIVAKRLVTNYQNRSIPCTPDTAGSKPLLFPPAG